MSLISFQISANNGKDEMQIQNELITILKEMGHNFQLSTVRVLAWFLAKLLRQLYQGLLINKDGIAKVLLLNFQLVYLIKIFELFIV